MTIDISRDIQSLSTFKRNSSKAIAQIKKKGNPLVLTVNGKAEVVVQDAAAYQKLLDKIKDLETEIESKKSVKDTSSSDILDLYGAALDIDFGLDSEGTSNAMDDDLTSAFDE